MGNLLKLMLDDEFDQLALFRGGLLGAGCSIETLARIACTSKLGRAWARKHLYLSGMPGVVQFLLNLKDTSAVDTLHRLRNGQFPLGYMDFSYPTRRGVVLWTVVPPSIYTNNTHQHPVNFDSQITHMISCDPSWLAPISLVMHTRPLYYLPTQLMSFEENAVLPYFSITTRGHALFRTFDDIILALFHPQPHLEEDTAIIHSHKRQRME